MSSAGFRGMLLSGKGCGPLFTPPALESVRYGELKEGLDFLVWKNYDWWS